MTTLEKIKLQKEYKGKRSSMQGAAAIAKVRLLKEAKEILAQLKGTSVQPEAPATINQVRDAMKDTGMASGWYMNAETNKIINSGVKQGWLYRPSTTQVEWTEEGVTLARQLDVPEKQPATADDVNAVMPMLKNFIGRSQLSAMGSGAMGEEGQFFNDKFIEVADTINKMPSTYHTDGQGDKAIAYLHYFKGGSDWYITEKDKGDGAQGAQEQAFGYAILNGDKQNAESGYVSIKELITAGVELDLYWNPKSLAEIKGKGPAGTIPTVDEVGAELEARGWKLGGNLDGGAWQLDPSVPAFVGKGSYLVTGIDAGGGNSGWITLDTLEDGVWSGLGRTIDLKNNTAASIVKEIENRIAEKEEQNPEPATPQNQKLTDLLSGKYDDLQPEAYLKVVQDIIIEINAVDQVKPALLSYLDKAKAKGLITE